MSQTLNLPRKEAMPPTHNGYLTIEMFPRSQEKWEVLLGNFLYTTNVYDEIGCGGFNTAKFGEPFLRIHSDALDIYLAQVVNDGANDPLGYRGLILEPNNSFIFGRILLTNPNETPNIALLRTYWGKGYGHTAMTMIKQFFAQNPPLRATIE